MVPVVVVNRRGADRARAGHPWIYRSDVLSAEVEPGDLVRVVTERDRPVGMALWSSLSQIALRLVGREVTGDERTFFRERLGAAIAYREAIAPGVRTLRLVHGEADGLPALVIDRYAEFVVIQTLSQGMDRRIGLLTELVVELLQPRGVLARNDAKVRRLEGLDEKVELLSGQVPERIEVQEGRARFSVDLWHGQKTGLFLDQRENHEAAGRYAHGRALDAFTYNGGFALAMASACDHVTAIDSSAHAVQLTRDNAVLNGLANVELKEANVFDELRELEVSGERFDTIVLDPPAFAKNRASAGRAAAGYKEINLRALKLLEPGGFLITSSCSYHVDEALFEQILAAASADAQTSLTLVEKRMQSRDHPVLLSAPETYYLKCFVLRRTG
jgi:23S rRNA (cytosine1962-C5)-methyltransferase